MILDALRRRHAPEVRNAVTLESTGLAGLVTQQAGETAAMKLAAVNRCIEVISDSVGKMPSYAMLAESRERVFERFYRVDKSHSKEIGGTGLGLSIVKHGALLHNAQIYLNSQVDRGTSIRLSFPK